MAFVFLSRSRVSDDLAAIARDRVHALASAGPARFSRPAGEGAGGGTPDPAQSPMPGADEEPVLITDAPPWPTSAATTVPSYAASFPGRAPFPRSSPFSGTMPSLDAADPADDPPHAPPPGSGSGFRPGREDGADPGPRPGFAGGDAAGVRDEGEPGVIIPAEAASPFGSGQGLDFSVRTPGHGRHESPRRRRLVRSRSLLPAPIRSARLAVDGRAAISVAVVVLLAALLGASYLWRARPTDAALPPPSLTVPVTPAPPAAAGVLVDVQGLVRKPGLVRLPTGSRVQDALRAAGGPAPGVGTASLNLARVLVDGEQLVVTKPGVAPPPGPGPAVGGAQPGQAGTAAPVDLNTATLDQLDSLPGVGPVLAQRILDWRNEHGRFGSVEELQEVDGIGERRFSDLRNRVRV